MPRQTINLIPNTKLRSLRLAEGLSREALAERLGVSADIVKSWERGKVRHPHPTNLGELSKVLGVAVDELGFDLGRWWSSQANEETTKSLFTGSNLEASSLPLPHLIDHLKDSVKFTRRLGDLKGPTLVYKGLTKHQELLEELARKSSLKHRHEILDLYAQITQQIGWNLYNLCDFQGAEYYYSSALKAAQEVPNNDLASYILALMSQLASYKGDPQLGVDLAVAAEKQAELIGNHYAQAYSANSAARAYADLSKQLNSPTQKSYRSS